MEVTVVINLGLSSGRNTTYPVPNASPVRAPGNSRRMTTTLPQLVASARPAGSGEETSERWAQSWLPRCKRIAGFFLPDVNLRACQVSARSESIALTARRGNTDHVPNCFGLPASPTDRRHDKPRGDSRSTRSPTSRLWLNNRGGCLQT